MKPHLIFQNRVWWCGILGADRIWWACAAKPDDAYRLWARGRA